MMSNYKFDIICGELWITYKPTENESNVFILSNSDTKRLLDILQHNQLPYIINIGNKDNDNNSKSNC